MADHKSIAELPGAGWQQKPSSWVLDCMLEFACRYEMPQLIHVLLNIEPLAVRKRDPRLLKRFRIAVLLQRFRDNSPQLHLSQLLEDFEAVVPADFDRSASSPYFFIVTQTIRHALSNVAGEKDFAGLFNFHLPAKSEEKDPAKLLLLGKLRSELAKYHILLERKRNHTPAEVAFIREFEKANDWSQIVDTTRNFLLHIQKIENLSATFLEHLEREIYVVGEKRKAAGEDAPAAEAESSRESAAASDSKADKDQAPKRQRRSNRKADAAEEVDESANGASSSSAAAAAEPPSPAASNGASASPGVTVAKLRHSRKLFSKAANKIEDPLPAALKIADSVRPAAASPTRSSSRVASRKLDADHPKAVAVSPMSEDEEENEEGEDTESNDGEQAGSNDEEEEEEEQEEEEEEEPEEKSTKSAASSSKKKVATVPKTPPPKGKGKGKKKKKERESRMGHRSPAQLDGTRRRWTPEEEEKLIRLVKKIAPKAKSEGGRMSWSSILDEYDFQRTTVDLKDKWRNLVKAGRVPPLEDL